MTASIQVSQTLQMAAFSGVVRDSQLNFDCVVLVAIKKKKESNLS